MNNDTKQRLETIEFNAKRITQERKRDPDYTPENHIPIEAPVIIASSADIGTLRARANHTDALMDFFVEQEYLKKNSAPIDVPTNY